MNNKLRLIIIISIIIILVIAFVKFREGSGNSPLQSSELKLTSPISQTSPTTQPSPTPSPVSNKKTTPTPKPTATSTPTPTPTPDTLAPTIWYVNPREGWVYNHDDFCFTVTTSDDYNQSVFPYLEMLYQLDFGEWIGWTKYSNSGNDGYPCFENVAQGSHVFNVKVRDKAGNESSVFNRNFKVELSTP